MEQFVLLVVIGLISLVNWIVQKSGKAREARKIERQESASEVFSASERPEPTEPQKEFDETRRDEPMRQLMEALGVEFPEVDAERSSPPPLVLRPEDYSAPLASSRLPSLVEEAERIENWTADAKVTHALPPREPRRSAASLRQAKVQTRKAPVRPKRVGELLTAPHGLRHGILLFEILGPPKALRKE